MQDVRQRSNISQFSIRLTESSRDRYDQRQGYVRSHSFLLFLRPMQIIFAAIPASIRYYVLGDMRHTRQTRNKKQTFDKGKQGFPLAMMYNDTFTIIICNKIIFITQRHKNKTINLKKSIKK